MNMFLGHVAQPETLTAPSAPTAPILGAAHSPSRAAAPAPVEVPEAHPAAQAPAAAPEPATAPAKGDIVTFGDTDLATGLSKVVHGLVIAIDEIVREDGQILKVARVAAFEQIRDIFL